MLPVLLAGCLWQSGYDGPVIEGNDEEPINADAEELGLDIDDLPGDGWEIDPGALVGGGNSHYQTFERDEGAEGIVDGVIVTSSVEAATNTLRGHTDLLVGLKDHTPSRRDLKVHRIGSEGQYVEWEKANVLFRDANVVGKIIHAKETGNGDVEIALDLAATMHESWRA